MLCWKLMILTLLFLEVSPSSLRIKTSNGAKVLPYRPDQNIQIKEAIKHDERICTSVKDCKGYSTSDLGRECNIPYCGADGKCGCTF